MIMWQLTQIIQVLCDMMKYLPPGTFLFDQY